MLSQTKIFEVTIQEDGEIINIGKVVNRPITGKLELIKTDIADGKPLPNAGFRIRNDAGEIVAEGIPMMKESLLLRWDMDRILMKSLMRRTGIRLIRRRTNFLSPKMEKLSKRR